MAFMPFFAVFRQLRYAFFRARSGLIKRVAARSIFMLQARFAIDSRAYSSALRAVVMALTRPRGLAKRRHQLALVAWLYSDTAHCG